MKNQKIKLVAIVGKAGSGKDYLLNYLCDNYKDFHKIISATTRPQREGEQEGVNYYYLSNEEFAKQILEDKFLEATVFNDWCYGTQLSALDNNKINIGVFNPTGIETLQQDNRIETYVIKIDATDKERLIRQLNREEDPNVHEIIRRFKTDEIDFEDSDFTINAYFPNYENFPFEANVYMLMEFIKGWANLDN